MQTNNNNKNNNNNNNNANNNNNNNSNNNIKIDHNKNNQGTQQIVPRKQDDLQTGGEHKRRYDCKGICRKVLK